MQVTCFHCQKVLTFPERIGRGDECPHCRSDVHVCKNCEFYDPKAYNECRESNADVVREKERSNFCDYFTAKVGAGAAGKSAADLKSAAEALFKKK